MMIKNNICCEHYYDHDGNECDTISEVNDKTDDKIDEYNGERDDVDEEDDLESTSSSISSPPSVPDEDINFDLVYALHSFAAVVTGQASVIKGDALILMDDSNSYWWLVEVLKTRELGYIPAENTETPFERLARLNKHRNVDITAPTTEDFLPLDDVQKKQRKNVTLGPEADHMVLVFEREDYDDYDDMEDDYYRDNDLESDDTCNHDLDDNDEHNEFCDDPNGDDIAIAPDENLENENVEQLTTPTPVPVPATTPPSNTKPLDDSDSDENDLDAFEDAQQDIDGFDHGSTLPASPTTATTETISIIDENATPENISSPNTDSTPPQVCLHSQSIIKNDTNQQNLDDKNREDKGVEQSQMDRVGRLETLRVFGGNILQGPLFHTFDIGLSTTAHDLLEMAIERFNLDTGYEGIEYYLSVQGLDGDDYILLAQDKPLPIFRTLTASLTTPMPRSSMEQQHQIAEAKKRLSNSSINSIGNRRRSTSFSNYEQTYYDEDSLIRFYLHQRIKRGRAGLLYIKVCLCRGSGQRKNLKNKNKKSSVIDRMEKIMAVQVDSQVGMVINEALAKFNVPDATAENFLGGLGDVRSFTKYRMSVYTNNNTEMPLQATQDMATLLTLLQIKWNVGERTLLTSDLLFIIYPSGGDKKGQRLKAPSLPLSRGNAQDQQPYSQERRPSILDILMDIPCSNELSSHNQGGVGVDSLSGDPLTQQQKIPSDSEWNTCSPSSIPYHNSQRRRSSIYSTTSESSSIPDNITDDMAFGFSSDKKVAAPAPSSIKQNSLKHHFKRWVGWGPKKNQQQQQQQQQQQTSSTSNNQPLTTSTSCIDEDICDGTSSASSPTPKDDQHQPPLTSATSPSDSPPQEPCDQGLRRPSNCTIGSTSSASSHLDHSSGTSSRVSNNSILEENEQSDSATAKHTHAAAAPIKSSTSDNTFCSSLATSTSNRSISSPIKQCASNHSITASATSEINNVNKTIPAPTATPISSTSSEMTTADPMAGAKLDSQSPPSSLPWDQDHNIQHGGTDSLMDSDISSISNSSIGLDSTLDGPYNQAGIGGNGQMAYEWLSDSDNDDSDMEDDGVGKQQQQQAHAQGNIDSPRESEDILAQYSSWMKRASLDAASTMNQHIHTTSATITTTTTSSPPPPPPKNASPSVSVLSSSSSSGSLSVSNSHLHQYNNNSNTAYLPESAQAGILHSPYPDGLRYDMMHSAADPGSTPSLIATCTGAIEFNASGLPSSIYSTSSFPSESFDTDALLLVTHGVDFLKDRESSNWEDDDVPPGKDDDENAGRYVFHPWTTRTVKQTVNGVGTGDPSPSPPVVMTTARPLSTATSATKLSTTSTAVNHGKRPSTAGITPSTSSSTSTTIEPSVAAVSAQKIGPLHHHDKNAKIGLGEKEGMDEELQRIVSMHVLF